MPPVITKVFPGVVATGPTTAVPAPGGRPFTRYGFQVKGQGGVPTSFTVACEGSIDGVAYTSLGTTTTDGATAAVVGNACPWVRLNCTALSLAPATSLSLYLTASG
jgi:hypothetical protein